DGRYLHRREHRPELRPPACVRGDPDDGAPYGPSAVVMGLVRRALRASPRISNASRITYRPIPAPAIRSSARNPVSRTAIPEVITTTLAMTSARVKIQVARRWTSFSRYLLSSRRTVALTASAIA